MPAINILLLLLLKHIIIYFENKFMLYILYSNTVLLCSLIAGLLNLFKSKISSPVSLETVSVAVRFTYILTDWTSNNVWTQEPPDFDFLQGETLGVPELGKLPFGAIIDPIR